MDMEEQTVDYEWEITVPDDETASVSNTSINKRSRKAVSPVWTYFEKLDDGSGLARCLKCGTNYQHSNNTSNLAKVFIIIIIVIIIMTIMSKIVYYKTI